jgi:hypothetical protein
VEVVENSDVGEHEDDDVRTERQKVADILSNWSAKPPVVVVQVIHYCVVTVGMVIVQNMYSDVHYRIHYIIFVDWTL